MSLIHGVTGKRHAPNSDSQLLPKQRCGVAANTSESTELRRLTIPVALIQKLDSWGPALCQHVTSARNSCAILVKMTHLAGRSLWHGGDLKVGTDCSGAEAPVWALQGMRVPHSHTHSCDVLAVVRAFIRATCQPKGPIFEDMLRRNVSDIPPLNIYYCGFPCKPFSRLRQHNTKLLKETTAKPFFKMLQVIRALLPSLCILENVVGIQQVMDAVLRLLCALRW